MKRYVAWVFAAVFLAALAGCAPSMRYSDEEIKGFDPKIQEYIKAGEVSTGMTKAQVRYSWGGPDEVVVLQPAADGRERVRWTYRRMAFFKTKLYFTGDVLTEIVSTEPGAGKE